MKYKIADKNILGNPITAQEKYHIIGGGVSGLMLGYFMKQKGIQFQIFEKSAQVGGLIQTAYIPNIGYAEQAANGFIWCKELADMTKAIGLDIQTPSDSAKARYLVRNNKLQKMPLNLLEGMGMAGKLLKPNATPLQTVADFGHAFLGKKATQQILEPAFAGIYGASITDLSFEAVLPFFAKELNHTNSLPIAIKRWKKTIDKNRKKHKGTHSFKGGFGNLTKALGRYLQDDIRTNQAIEQIQSGQATVITTPAYVSQHFFEGELKEILAKIQYTPVITTTLVFEKKDLPRLKAGFGCLIPRNEGLKILGVLFNSYIFEDRVENDQHISVTCIFRDNEGVFLDQNEEDILESVLLPDLKKLFDLQSQPLAYRMFKWKKGIPLYDNYLASNWDNIHKLLQNEYPNVRLLGNYTGQISVRGMAQFINNAV